MIGRKQLPQKYREWNERWGAPFGRSFNADLSISERIASDNPAGFGPFAFQWSSATRSFEYPWAYFSALPGPGRRIIDVGGGLAGLQFVLAMDGCEVTNIDPSAKEGEETWLPFPGHNWPCTPDNHQRLNEIFGTKVQLVPEKVQDADLPANSFDAAICLSVIEHVPQEEARRMVEGMARLLRPGGRILLTTDLFLDVKPFGVLDKNVWGTNIDICKLVEGQGLEIAMGDRRELLGFPEFDFDRVVSLLPELLVAYYPCVPESIVLRKPE
jgi:SAM-dependent methyltransferase